MTNTAIPKEIKQASNLVFLSIGVGFVKALLFEVLNFQKTLTDPKLLAIGIFTFAVTGFLGFKVGQGKNWARITLLVLFILGMIGYPFIVFEEFKMNIFIGIVSIIQALIQLYVLIILFSGKAKQWYKNRK